MKKYKEEKKHALFSASSADRWIACPASVQLSAKLPKPPESAYAQEGTDAHSCLEALLRAGPHKQMATESFLEKSFPLEMVKHATSAAQYVWKLAPKGVEIVAESKSKLDHIDPDMGGTSDVVIAEDFGTLYIVDFKYGVMPVEVAMNSQLLTYALAEAHKRDYNFEKIVLVIIQPRAFHKAGPIREWETDMANLVEWANTLKLAATLARRKDAKFQSGKHCFFCPAKAGCPEISKKAMEDARVDFAPKSGKLITPHMTQLPQGKELAHLLNALQKLDVWSKSIRAHAWHRASSGHKIPGWKLIDKRGSRKWIDAVKARDEARKAFGELAFTPPELLSPAQLEKVKSKKARQWVASRTVVISSGTRLVPEDSDGEEIDQLALDFAPAEPEKKKR